MKNIEELSTTPPTQELTKLKELSLQEILDSENFILIDNSIGGSTNDFTIWLYDLNKPDQLNLKRLNQEVYGLQKFQEILIHPNTYTKNNITKEQKALVDIISEKISFFKENTHKIKNTRWKKRAEKEYNPAFEALLEIQEIIYQNKQTCHYKELDKELN